MRADEHGLPLAGLPAPEQVPGRIDLDLEAELAHPLAEPSRTPRRARRYHATRVDAACRVGPDRGELGERVGDGARAQEHMVRSRCRRREGNGSSEPFEAHRAQRSTGGATTAPARRTRTPRRVTTQA